MSPIPTIVEAAAIPLAVVRRRAAARELSSVVPAACGEVWSFLREAGVTGAGRHVAIYHDGVINLEIGVELAVEFPANGKVVRSATPSGRVATAPHIGPYSRLGAAHDAIRTWCTQHGHQFAGPNWEIYGHWTDDPAQLRTDVFYLLQ